MLRLCHRCPRLADLTLPPDSGDVLAEIAVRSLRCLRSLRLDGAAIGAGHWLADLPASMTSLQLTSCRLEDAGALRRANMPHLRQLEISGEVLSGWGGMEEALARWPELRRLDVGRSGIPNELVRQLPELLPELRELRLNQCSSVSSWGAARLHRLQHLHTLNVVELQHSASEGESSPADTAGLLAALERIKSLRELTIGDMCSRRSRQEMQITPGCVQRLLLALPRLETLQVYMDYGTLECGFWRDVQGLRPPLPPGREVTLKLFGVLLKKDITFIGFSRR